MSTDTTQNLSNIQTINKNPITQSWLSPAYAESTPTPECRALLTQDYLQYLLRSSTPQLSTMKSTVDSNMSNCAACGKVGDTGLKMCTACSSSGIATGHVRWRTVIGTKMSVRNAPPSGRTKPYSNSLCEEKNAQSAPCRCRCLHQR